MEPHLILTIDEFLAAPQEVVLLHRHGRTDSGRSRTPIGSNVRHAIKEVLRSREIDCHVTFEVCGTAIRLNTAGFYENEGRLCRIVYLSSQQAETRRSQATARELELVRIAGWVAERYFATPPKGLRLYYHVFRTSGPDADICESWYREYPLAPESEVRQVVAERTQRLGEALAKPDAALLECTVEERDGAPGSEYSKCRDWCPARQHCQQIDRYYQQETERWLASERALSSIVAEEGPTFAEKEAARRKELIAGMMMAGNFFEEDFPRESFRALLKAEAEAEEDDLQKKKSLLEMATEWSNARFVQWRALLDNQD